MQASVPVSITFPYPTSGRSSGYSILRSTEANIEAADSRSKSRMSFPRRTQSPHRHGAETARSGIVGGKDYATFSRLRSAPHVRHAAGNGGSRSAYPERTDGPLQDFDHDALRASDTGAQTRCGSEIGAVQQLRYESGGRVAGVPTKVPTVANFKAQSGQGKLSASD